MAEKTALLLIDVQANMFDPANPVDGSTALLERLRGLLRRARDAGAPVVFVRNNGGPEDPDLPNTPGWELQLPAAPGDLVLDKTTCNTFESTALEGELKLRGVTRLVIAGLQSDSCVRETTLGALQLGFPVTLASDGHSTYDGKMRTAAEISAAVNQELAKGATLMPVGEITFAE
jgi:nicotinamidase-related amidase